MDWNRHARSGELATLEFHEERAARVLVLIDARKASYLAHQPDAAHAIDRSVEAAGRIAASLLDTGDTVGLAALGPVNREANQRLNLRETCWIAPRRDNTTEFDSARRSRPTNSSRRSRPAMRPSGDPNCG
ncbi:DUF58 domain-containing protein [Saliphagus sp. GCM10025308]